MSDTERNKLNMYESVVSVCLENREIINSVRSFPWSITKLRKVIDEIKRKEKELSSETLEKTIITYKLKDELIFSLVPVVSSLFNFAKESNNLSLKDKTRHSQSYYVRLRDKELLDKAYGIYSLAERSISRLKKFGISIHSLNELKVKADQFKNALDNKIISFVSSSTVLSLNNLFGEADKILNDNLDIYMEALSGDFEEFYEDYLEARSVEAERLLDEEEEVLDVEEEN